MTTVEENCTPLTASNEDLHNDEINGEISDEEPNFSDPDDFVDDEVDNEPSLVELKKTCPALHTDFDDVIIIDNVPSVGEDRLDKLKTAMSKILSKFGTVVEDFYPIDPELGMTAGYVMIRFADEQSALSARKQLDGHRLDKSHQFTVNTFKEFYRYINISNEWEQPKIPEFIECPTLLDWMSMDNAVDQFSIVNNGLGKRSNTVRCAVYYNLFPEPQSCINRQLWTEKNFAWSPLGTYLASFHDKGIVIWGGVEFDRLARIAHHNVTNILFSPCERFAITSAWLPASQTIATIAGDQKTSRVASIYISDISVSTTRRTFTQEVQSQNLQDSKDDSNMVIIGGSDDAPSWLTDAAPIAFKWSFDGKYFARLSSQDSISVYSSETYSLVHKKSMKIPMISNFEWALSKNNYIAMYQCERGDTPARLSVVSIPNCNEIRGNNLFNVAACKIFWQMNSDYVCFQLDRYIKQKIKEDAGKPLYMNMYHNFEIFRMRERNCPIETMELKSQCLHFSWEPNGNRFIIIHEVSPGKTKVNFYKVSTAGIEDLKELNVDVNHAEWSPINSFLALASFRGRLSHRIYFIDTSDLSVMAEEDHHMMSQIAWDPTGRYLVSCAYSSFQTTDAGYIIWSFQGRKLSVVQLSDFTQFLWRPRHPSLLTEDKLKEIKKSFKQYCVKFKELDEISASKLTSEQRYTRQRLAEEFAQFRQISSDRLQLQAQCRRALRNLSNNSDKPEKYEVESFDFLLSIDVEPIDI
ncbi:hypothetical protein GJ496_003963 [Pomphorhynchus laevis]|nr:hypothetical protein GJ496_003963 [Pomphorhynchus laevis]